MKSRKTSSASMAVILIVQSFILIGISDASSASTSGDVYSGSGDWDITNPTTYTGESLTVYGNITIHNGGSLTLSNSDLILDQDSDYNRSIQVGATSLSYLRLQAGSSISTTNVTSGIPNAVINMANYGYMEVDNSTLANVFVWVMNMPANAEPTHISYSTLTACMVWNQFAFGYEQPNIPYGPLILNHCNFEDANIVHHVSPDTRSMISTGNNVIITGCEFSNITLESQAADFCSYIRVISQDNFTISQNTFDDSIYPKMYVRGENTDWISDSHIDGNIFLGLGGVDEASATSGVYLRGTAIRTTFEGNVFNVVRNASKGVLIAGSGWYLEGNRFDNIDATGLTTSGVSAGIYVESPGMCTIENTVINNIRGCGVDAGAASNGIRTIDAGNVTVQYSTMRNISNVASWGIAFADSAVFAGLGNLIAHANSFYNLTKACGAIYWYSGTGGIASWNNVSSVDGSAMGIMLHATKNLIHVHNNSVIGMYYASNEWPFWSISPAAYSVCAGNVWNATFWDNHAEGYTGTHPAYDINAENLAGGFYDHSEAIINVKEDTTIRQYHANVTVMHSNLVCGLKLDNVSTSQKYYADGTSWKYFANPMDEEYHWINVTATSLYLSPENPTEVTVLSWSANTSEPMRWTAESSIDDSLMSYTLTDLRPSVAYDVYIDGGIRTYVADGEGTISFSYSAATGEHTFEVRISIVQEMIDIVWMVVPLLFIFGMLGIVVGVFAGFGKTGKK